MAVAAPTPPRSPSYLAYQIHRSGAPASRPEEAGPGASATVCGRFAARNTRARTLGLGLFSGCGDETDAPELNAAFCDTVAGTLNIHREAVAGGVAPCTGIEMTDGVVADAQDGMATFDGVSVTNASCISPAAYEFTVSQDGLSLNGSDTRASVPLTLTRSADEACFVGHWVLRGEDYRGHIAAEPFGVVVGP